MQRPMKRLIDFAKSTTFRISGLGIEVMCNDIGKGDYGFAEQAVRRASNEGWRLPTSEECFALWGLKQLGCGNIKDYYYWTTDEKELARYGDSKGYAFIFKMDTPFVGRRSVKDYYYVRLVRDL